MACHITTITTLRLTSMLSSDTTEDPLCREADPVDARNSHVGGVWSFKWTCHRSKQEKTTDRRGRLHPPRCTTARDDRRIVRISVMDRAAPSQSIAQYIQLITHHSVSVHTIRRRLQQSGMSARRTLLRIPLTGNHRRLCCQ
ncbi:transposable element Tc1 transposase [Trichonephila clavipes]|nr:transposable element Tc1 transposase [Trichonephila clavipes]